MLHKAGRKVLTPLPAGLRRFLSREGVRVSHVPSVSVTLNSTRANSAALRQSTNEVLMVAPTAFGFNDQVGCRMLCPLYHSACKIF